MLISGGIVGQFDPARDVSERVDFVDVPWADATKRRLRRATNGGVDFALAMEHSDYLFHGAVLLENDKHVIVVNRPEEPALIIDLDQNRPPHEVLQQAALIGHAFGNQHIPIEVDAYSIVAPVLTSESVMDKTLHDLGFGNLTFRFDTVRLGCRRPLIMTGHSHG